MAIKIVKAEFITGATGPESYPDEGLPEIAIAGRSNVGKSSLINRLVNRKNLAKTSVTPGRTRQMNFFLVNDSLLLVDLPGYGYAKVSKDERASWGKMVSRYLTGRKPLKALVAIFDIRRDPSNEDLDLMEMVSDLSIPPIIALTKADKINRGQINRRKSEIAELLDLNPSDLVPFSAETGLGKWELWKAILERVKAGGLEDEK